MSTYLKRSLSTEDKQVIDTNVRDTVERILNDVRQRGDTAVRELSAQFDRWSPEQFRLSPAEIEAIIHSLPTQVIDDIQFAQAQVRRFAEAQRGSFQDVEVETLPGVTLGHRHIPVSNVGCYIPGGRYPMV